MCSVLGCRSLKRHDSPLSYPGALVRERLVFTLCLTLNSHLMQRDLTVLLLIMRRSTCSHRITAFAPPLLPDINESDYFARRLSPDDGVSRAGNLYTRQPRRSQNSDVSRNTELAANYISRDPRDPPLLPRPDCPRGIVPSEIFISR